MTLHNEISFEVRFAAISLRMALVQETTHRMTDVEGVEPLLNFRAEQGSTSWSRGAGGPKQASRSGRPYDRYAGIGRWLSVRKIAA